MTDEPKKPLIVADHLIQAGVPTANGNVYSEEVLGRMVKDAQERVEGRRLLGSIDSDEDGRQRIGNISHVVTKLEMKGGRMVAEVEPIDTPQGNHLRWVLQRKLVPLTLASRMIGSVRDGVVGEDAKLVSVDIVPSEDQYEFKDGRWLRVVPDPETRGGTMLTEEPR